MRYVQPGQPGTPTPQPSTAPSGEPIEKFKITLRVFGGEGFDPDQVTRALGCRPTASEVKGQRVVTPSGTRVGLDSRWSLTVESDHGGEVEQAITSLLNRLPSNLDLWRELTQRYYVDIYCGMFLKTANRGFTLSPQVSRLLVERNLGIGFNLFFERTT